MKIGFIGCGNMGSALLSAAVKSVDKKSIAVSDADTKKAEEVCGKFGTNLSCNEEIAKNAQYIFLGVKPQMLDSLFGEISEALKNRKDRYVIVSMAAGVSIELLKQKAGIEKIPVIRIMPNIPVSVGEGVVLFAGSGVSDDEKTEFTKMMKESGYLHEIEEEKIDAASCISGCGPAFVYMFIEALSDGGVSCGLPRDISLKLACETLIGSAKTVLLKNEHPGKLKDNVCSPAGSTIEGVKALEKGSFRFDTISAVCEAYKRTKELGK